MTDTEESFVEERYPKDLMVSRQDIEAIDLNGILKKASREETTFLSFTLSDTAKKEKEKGNISTAKALWLLADIASMMMTPKDKDNPFKPFMQMVNGTRSTAIEDFTDEDFSFFRATVEFLEDFRLRARVADVLWTVGKPTREFEMVKLAIESYMQYPIDEDTMLREGFEAWSRAIFLAKSIGKSGVCYLSSIEKALFDRFKSLEDKSSYLANRISDLLFEVVEDVAKSVFVAEDRERVANELYEDEKWVLSRNVYEDALRWSEKARKPFEKRYELRDRIAMTWIEEAKAHLKNDNGIAASTFFQKAIDELRMIPTKYRHDLKVDEKIRLCREKLREANLKSKNQMKPVETGAYDISPIIEQSQKYVTNRQWPIVLAYFTNVCRPPSKRELEKSAEDTMNKSIFRMLASSTILSSDGRVVARTPSINPGDPNDPARLLVLEDEKHMHFSIWIGLNVQGSILPALDIIVGEHEITEEKLYELCAKSILVPIGRERFWAKGLFFGFKKDFMTAIHLLSPQLEHFIRVFLKHHGIVTTTIDSHGLEFEVGLSTLLEKQETSEIFKEDFLDELKMLMVSQRGPNLRNEIAHGLMEEEHADSYNAIYFWWRMLKIMVDGILVEKEIDGY